MENLARPGDEIEEYNDLTTEMECQKKCFLNDECYIWTYIGGICYMKNDNTFLGHGDNVVSGAKNCSSSGTFNRKQL